MGVDFRVEGRSVAPKKLGREPSCQGELRALSAIQERLSNALR